MKIKIGKKSVLCIRGYSYHSISLNFPLKYEPLADIIIREESYTTYIYKNLICGEKYAIIMFVDEELFDGLFP